MLSPVATQEPDPKTPMGKPNLHGVRIDTWGALKRYSTLTAEHLNSIRSNIIKFVHNDKSGTVQAMPRTMVDERWARFIREIVEGVGVGEVYWAPDRVGFDADCDFVWPDDKEE
jgi:hypothetical protein